MFLCHSSSPSVPSSLLIFTWGYFPHNSLFFGFYKTYTELVQYAESGVPVFVDDIHPVLIQKFSDDPNKEKQKLRELYGLRGD